MTRGETGLKECARTGADWLRFANWLDNAERVILGCM